MEWVLLMGPALTAAALTAGMGWLSTRRKENLENITNERKLWRNEIRALAQEIHKASLKKGRYPNNNRSIDEVLVDLKVRLNPFGLLEEANLTDDGHLWAVIKELEEMASKHLDNETADFQKKKKQLVMFLSGLLKFDWERSKMEVKGDIYRQLNFVCSMIIWVLNSSFHVLVWHEDTQDSLRIFFTRAIVETLVILSIWGMTESLLRIKFEIRNKQMVTWRKIGSRVVSGIIAYILVLLPTFIYIFYSNFWGSRIEGYTRILLLIAVALNVWIVMEKFGGGKRLWENYRRLIQDIERI